MRRAKLFAHWIDAVNKRVGESVTYLILPLMSITMLEVILRYVFNRPTIWAWDVNVQLQAALVALAGGYVLLSGRFVVMDVFVGHLTPKARARLDLITSVVIFFVMGILVLLGTKEAWHSLLVKEHTSTLFRPVLYPLRFVVLIGFILLFFQAVSRFIHDLITVTGRKVGPPIIGGEAEE